MATSKQENTHNNQTQKTKPRKLRFPGSAKKKRENQKNPRNPEKKNVLTSIFMGRQSFCSNDPLMPKQEEEEEEQRQQQQHPQKRTAAEKRKTKKKHEKTGELSVLSDVLCEIHNHINNNYQNDKRINKW